VARMVLRQALQPAMAGILAGAGGALGLHAILRAQIEGAERCGFTPARVITLQNISVALPLSVPVSTLQKP
jgi:hypothetical protein